MKRRNEAWHKIHEQQPNKTIWKITQYHNTDWLCCQKRCPQVQHLTTLTDSHNIIAGAFNCLNQTWCTEKGYGPHDGVKDWRISLVNEDKVALGSNHVLSHCHFVAHFGGTLEKRESLCIPFFTSADVPKARWSVVAGGGDGTGVYELHLCHWAATRYTNMSEHHTWCYRNVQHVATCNTAVGWA